MVGLVTAIPARVGPTVASGSKQSVALIDSIFREGRF